MGRGTEEEARIGLCLTIRALARSFEGICTDICNLMDSLIELEDATLVMEGHLLEKNALDKTEIGLSLGE